MSALQPDWFTQNWLDSEYQQYVVMAYLQSVQQQFATDRLYPILPELRCHYESARQFAEGKGSLTAAFPRRMRGITGPPPRIDYVLEVPEDTYLAEIDSMLAFALPRFRQAMADGEQRLADIAGSLTLEPIGLMPLQPQEGYLLLCLPGQSAAQVYHFQLTLYADQVPGGRVVRFAYVESVEQGLGNTAERIKLDLIRRYRHLPNPATFRLASERSYPISETLLPIARQLLAKAVA